jgi:hypothetical protein
VPGAFGKYPEQAWQALHGSAAVVAAGSNNATNKAVSLSLCVSTLYSRFVGAYHPWQSLGPFLFRLLLRQVRISWTYSRCKVVGGCRQGRPVSPFRFALVKDGLEASGIKQSSQIRAVAFVFIREGLSPAGGLPELWP